MWKGSDNSMELTQITFKLPPRGLLIRDFVIATISSILEDPVVKSIKNEGDRIVIETPLGMESYILNQMFQTAQRIVESKLNLISSPRLVGNDVNVLKKFQKETKRSISDEETLLNFAFRVLEWASEECCKSVSKFLMSYNFIQEKPSTLILGENEYAALQLFKVEKYEYGRDFLKNYEAIKMQIKHDVYWLALLMAGLSLTYSGRIENELVFTAIPEDFAFYEKQSKTTTHLFFNLPARILYNEARGISFIVSKVGFFDPIFAFLQLISYALVREWYGDFDLELLSQAPIQIYRVRLGQTYTLVEKNTADLVPFVRFAYKLLKNGEKSALVKIENLLRNYYRLDYSEYYSVSVKLYQTILGSYNAYDLIYELGRLLAPITNKKIFNEEEIRAIANVFTTT